jgi:hypothetical protein
MTFRRQTYRLRLAPECERPFDNIRGRLKRLNLSTADFVEGLNRIRDLVQQGMAPPGMTRRASHPGFYFLAVGGQHVAFRVDEERGLLIIEELH